MFSFQLPLAFPLPLPLPFQLAFTWCSWETETVTVTGGQKNQKQQDLSWFLMKFYFFFDTDQNPFWVKFFYLQYLSAPHVPMWFYLFVSGCNLTFQRETWGEIVFTGFFTRFLKNGIFFGCFGLFFEREEQSKKMFLILNHALLTMSTTKFIE